MKALQPTIPLQISVVNSVRSWGMPDYLFAGSSPRKEFPWEGSRLLSKGPRLPGSLAFNDSPRQNEGSLKGAKVPVWVSSVAFFWKNICVRPHTWSFSWVPSNLLCWLACTHSKSPYQRGPRNFSPWSKFKGFGCALLKASSLATW